LRLVISENVSLMVHVFFAGYISQQKVRRDCCLEDDEGGTLLVDAGAVDITGRSEYDPRRRSVWSAVTRRQLRRSR